MGFFQLETDASFYSVADYRLHHGTLPLGPVAVLLQPAWAPGIVLLGLAILLFPDGRVPSRRWRWVLWVYLTAGVLWLAGAFTVAGVAIIGHHIRVDASGNLQAIDPGGSASWWAAAEVGFLPVFGLCWLASLVSQAASWRRSSGERRQRLKWLLAGVYAGLVLLATQVRHFHTSVAVAVATLVAAGCSGRWTAGSTAPATTPTRPWPRSRPASKTRSTSPPSAMTWPRPGLPPWRSSRPYWRPPPRTWPACTTAAASRTARPAATACRWPPAS